MSTQVQWGKTFGLASILVGLGLFAFWLEVEHKPKQQKSDEEAKQFLKLKGKTIAEIRINNGSFEAVFQCSDLSKNLCKTTDQSNWMMTTPASVKADTANVDGFLSSMQSMTATDVIDLSSETTEKRDALLKEYGLDISTRQSKNSKSFSFIEASGNKITAHFGEVNPLTDGFFVGVSSGNKDSDVFESNKIYVVPGYVRMNFDHDQTYWRDKKLFTISASEIEKFELKGPKGKVAAVKSGNQWMLEYTDRGKEFKVAGDFENIESLLNSALLGQAQNFYTVDNLKGTAHSVTLSLQKSGSDSPLTLMIYANPKNDKIFAKVSNLDPVFGMDPGFLTRVNRSAADLRKVKLITTMDRFGVQKINTQGQTFNNQDGNWIIEGSKTTVSSEKIQELLDKLSSNKIQDILMSLSPAEADRKTEIHLFSKEGSAKKFIFWKDAKGTLYSQEISDQRPINPITYKIDPSLESSLPFEPNFFQVTIKK